MIGKVIEIGKTSVVVELAINDEQKKNLMNFHVAFDTDTSTIIGEITSIGEKNTVSPKTICSKVISTTNTLVTVAENLNCLRKGYMASARKGKKFKTEYSATSNSL